MKKTFCLLNVDEGIGGEDIRIDRTSGEDLPQSPDWSIRKQRLHGGLSDGVDVVWLDTGSLKLAVLPTRGMGIWKGEAHGIPVQWRSPVERPVHPAFVDQNRRGGIGWLDGFNELICRCGLGWHGAPGTDVISDEKGQVISEQFLPLHGRIANLSAHRVDAVVDDGGGIELTGVVDEASMFGGRLRLNSTLQLNSSQASRRNGASFRITDTVTNLGSGDAEVEMLYHCNIGRPFLGEGSTFHTAASEMAPRDARASEGLASWSVFDGPQNGYAEQVYFTKPLADDRGQALSVLASANRQHGFAVRFDTSTLPYFALWKNTQAEEDGYVTGLEPASSFPNLRSVERKGKRVIVLHGGQSVTFEFTCEIATTESQVAALIAEVSQLQEQTAVRIHPGPKPEWTG